MTGHALHVHVTSKSAVEPAACEETHTHTHTYTNSHLSHCRHNHYIHVHVHVHCTCDFHIMDKCLCASRNDGAVILGEVQVALEPQNLQGFTKTLDDLPGQRL